MRAEAVVVAVLMASAVLLAVAVHAEVDGDWPVQVQVAPDGDGGAQVTAGVDLMAYTAEGRRRRAVRRAATRERRQNMTIPERVKDHLKENWKTYATAATVVAVDRYAYNNVKLYYDWLGIKSSTSSGGTRTGDDATIIVGISGDSNNVVVQLPAGSGEGMTGSSGAGGQGNTSETTSTF